MCTGFKWAVFINDTFLHLIQRTVEFSPVIGQGSVLWWHQVLIWWGKRKSRSYSSQSPLIQWVKGWFMLWSHYPTRALWNWNTVQVLLFLAIRGMVEFERVCQNLLKAPPYLKPLTGFHRYVPAPGQAEKERLCQCHLVWHQQWQQHLWRLDLPRPGPGLHCKYTKA